MNPKRFLHNRVPDRTSIYLAYAATSPLAPRVLDAMRPFLEETFGNPSSVHTPGRNARFAVEEARENVASLLGAEPGEIIFTSGGTESNNAALKGVMDAGSMTRLVTASVEHESVLRTAQSVERSGTEVIVLACSGEGSVIPAAIEAAIQTDPALVSVMHVNNEIGTVNPISDISNVVHRSGGILHCDAVQSAGYYDLKKLAGFVDLMTLSAHKIGGPKGAGILFAKAGVQVDPFILGGSQERRRRAGTENVAAIAGLSEALSIAQQDPRVDSGRLRSLREFLEARLETELGNQIRVTTPDEGSAPHILHVVFLDEDGSGLDGEMLILGLDMEGVYVSSGSACSSGAVEPSHVLTALGVQPSVSRGAVRFSLGSGTTEEEIDEAIDRITRVVRQTSGAAIGRL
ncbi:MAG: cysteine desulfurase [Bacteroidetes bacterium]|nr:cysteine desulfurase [Bacteroidota bacterium]